MFNMGVEGQLYLGAFAAAWVGFTFQGATGPPNSPTTGHGSRGIGGHGLGLLTGHS